MLLGLLCAGLNHSEAQFAPPPPNSPKDKITSPTRPESVTPETARKLSSLPPIVPPLPSVSGTMAGTIEGTFKVNDMGSGTYTVPLSVPPGTAGLIPKLSLSYNSGQGVGLLGPGWEIEGLSAISRCPRTFAQDGYIAGITFTTSDALCLNGNRLISVSGAYGENNTHYRTERESFSNIVSLGQSGVGPNSFIVYHKDSLIYEYGNTDDSRLRTSGTAGTLAWKLNKVSDRSGNYLTITYANDPQIGENQPLRIDYTGNSNTGLAPYNSVRFEYETLPASMVRYIAGGAFTNRSHLLKISTFTGESSAWEYRFWYNAPEAIAQERRLAGVKKCTAQGVCLPATSFFWDTNNQDAPLFSAASTTLGDLSPQQGYANSTNSSIIFGDWDGDGRTDIARSLGANTVAYCSTGSGFSLCDSFPPGIEPPTSGYYDYAHSLQTFSGDWNGDGRTDIGRVTLSYGIAFYLSTPGEFQFFGNVPGLGVSNAYTNENRYPIITGDWNGDGRTDFARVGEDVTRFYRSTGTGFVLALTLSDFAPRQGFNISSTNPILTSDFNGDGLTDVGRVAAGGVVVRLSTGTDFGPRIVLPNFGTAQGFTDGNTYPILTGDWNGDGLADIARVRGEVVSFCESTGVGFAPCRELADFSLAQGYSNGNTYPIFTGDFNGDGVGDIARVYSGGVKYYTQKNGVFYGPYLLDNYGASAGYTDGNVHPVIVGDWNGDGFTDIGRISASGVSFQNRTTTKTNLLGNIINGLGHRIQISYAHLSNSSIYTKETGAVYPTVDLKLPVTGVSWVAIWDGLGTQQWTSYHYTGLRAELNGRGFSGVKRVDATDLKTGIKNSTFYRQDYPFQGQPYKTEVRQSNGKLLNIKEDTWAFISSPYGSHFPYISQSVESAYELDESFVKSSSTAFTYDNFGNVVQSVGEFNDGYRETTTNSYSNDETNWLIGKLEETTVTKSAPDAEAITRSASFEYLPDRGLTSKEITEPNDPEDRFEKSYSYDAYGNIVATTVLANGVETLLEEKTYDLRGQFAVTSSNALHHTETRSYDPRYGQVTSIRGPNNLTTTFAFDAFGRLVSETRADQTVTRTLYLKADSASPPGSAYFVRTDVSGEPPTIKHFDELGREIRRVATSFDGRKIFVDRAFDERGNLTHLSEPYFEGETPQWSVSEYDNLGRITRVTAPGNRVTTTTYFGFTTTVTNPLNQQTVTTTNSLGKVVSVKDANNKTTTYRYDSYSNLTEIRDSLGHVTLMTFDDRGNRTSIDDPNSGVTTFDYDARGRLTREEAGSSVTTFTYDALNRMASRTSPEGTETWEYDTARYGIGKLARVRGIGNFVESYEYDPLGRLTATQKVISRTTYTTRQTFDQLGRTSQLRYPSGWTIRNFYNKLGYLSEVRTAADNLLIWKAEARNARNQLEKDRFGNGLGATHSYDVVRGLPKRITISGIHDLEFTFDALGNFLKRKDYIVGKEESFQYDSLNRLTQAHVSGSAAVTITYDELGNITSRSDVGTYLYGENGAGPHALTSINGATPNTFSYDTRGNRTASLNQALQYTSFNLPYAIITETKLLRFAYDPNRKRFEQRIEDRGSGALEERRVYIDGIYEQVLRGGALEEVHYVNGSDGIVAIYTTGTGIPPKLSFLHLDHLGSITTITDATGQVTERLSFDPWGKRRNGDWTPAAQPILSSTTRGFTGHEHLDAAALIHMNGRVYDPAVGRFLSVDPVIQDPFNSQSLNAYSYVLNNPLSFTDPTGMFSLKKFFKKWLPLVVNLVANYFLPGSSSMLNAAISAFSSNFVGTLVNGGSFADSLKAGFSSMPMAAINAQATFMMGSVVDEQQLLVRAVAHGFTQGALTEVEGGDFRAGFFSGSFGTYGAASGNLIGAALAGGAGSVLGKGEFADGAMRGAFVYLYNDKKHPETHFFSDNDPLAVISGSGWSFEQSLQLQLQFQVPGVDSSVENGGIYDVNMLNLWFGYKNAPPIPHFGEVTVRFGADGTIYNFTNPWHIFHTGFVARKLFVRDSVLYMRTIGFGVGGQAMQSLNQKVGPSVFGKMNENFRAYLNCTVPPP